MEECGNDWNAYLARILAEFLKSLVYSPAKYEGCVVRCPSNTIDDAEHGTFWHCISDSKEKKQQGQSNKGEPDLRRMERILWVRAIIDNANSSDVERWVVLRSGKRHHVLWYREEYLVVLAEQVRKRDGLRYFVLKSAYQTDRGHTIARLRRERDEARKQRT